MHNEATRLAVLTFGRQRGKQGCGIPKQASAPGEVPFEAFSDRSSTLLASTKGVLDEHLFLQRRFCREMFALIHNRKALSWRRFRGGAFAIRTFAFCYFSCYNGCKNKQEVIQIHFSPYTVRPCATGADFLAGVNFPYISIKEELQKLRLIPHKSPLFFGILPKNRNKKSTNRYIGNAGKLILICYN